MSPALHSKYLQRSAEGAPVAAVEQPSDAYHQWNAVAGISLGVLLIAVFFVMLTGSGLVFALLGLIGLIVGLIGRASAR